MGVGQSGAIWSEPLLHATNGVAASYQRASEPQGKLERVILRLNQRL